MPPNSCNLFWSGEDVAEDALDLLAVDGDPRLGAALEEQAVEVRNLEDHAERVGGGEADEMGAEARVGWFEEERGELHAVGKHGDR